MRPSSMIFILLPALGLTEGAAQEPADETLRDLLCEQCPFDALVRIPPGNAVTPNMRSLGIVTVRDMIDRLPNNIASQGAAGDEAASAVDSPFDLGRAIRELRRTIEPASRDSESDADTATVERSQDSSDSVEEESVGDADDGEADR